jgi:PAS domain-containing protein
MNKANFRVFILPLVFLFCTVFYYFGELIDWAAWDVLRANFFYGVHDIHRLLFVIPIIYAGYYNRIRGAIIITLISFVVFLPRAFFISPYPDPLLRMIIFTVFAGVIGVFVGIIRNQAERSRELETIITSERDRGLKIIDGIADGIIITGLDYRIRFMNTRMKESFGEGTGIPCYKHLRNLEAPCETGCHISDVISNEQIMKWECNLTDGNTYEVLAAPYSDSDGTVCQISIFRDITQRQ